MIESVHFDQETRSFSKVSNYKFKDFQLKFGYSSKLAVSLLPQLAFTSFKFTPVKSIFDLEGKEKEREEYLIKGLVNQCPNVEILRARRYNNAGYINGMDKLLKDGNYTEDDIKKFCKELGIDYSEFKSKLGPHMILVGDLFHSAPIIAHEMGHYLNTISQGEPRGDKYHQRYQSAQTAFSIVGILGTLVSLGALIMSASGTWVLAPLAISKLSQVLVSSPVIKAERVASITGLKLLSKLGLTEQEEITYKLLLKEALNTYKAGYRWKPLILSVPATVGTVVSALT